jgi:hypothetical protein
MVAEIASGRPNPVVAPYPFGRLRPGNQLMLNTEGRSDNPVGVGLLMPVLEIGLEIRIADKSAERRITSQDGTDFPVLLLACC